MKTGIIKFVNRDKMFGFIAPDSGAPDVYMRLGDVTPEFMPLLEAGSSVTYVEQQKYGKTYAVEVKVATTPESQRLEKQVSLSVVPELTKFAEVAKNVSPYPDLDFLLQWQWSKRPKPRGRLRR